VPCYVTVSRYGTSTLLTDGFVVCHLRPLTTVLSRAPAQYLPSAHYWQAQRVNTKLRVLGDALLHDASTHVVAASGTGSSSEVVGVGGVAAIGGSGEGPAWTALLGFFSHEGGVVALLLQNQDPEFPNLFTLTLDAGVVANEVDPSSGAVAPVLDDAPSMPGLQLSVDSGDARLLYLSS
jgi:hypothetical protein